VIVCSCNVFTDHQLRSALGKVTKRPRMSQVYGYLGGSAQCGQCAHTIKGMLKETTNWAIGPPSAIERRGLRSD
jgi:bacterioferritin-associated ferredoxin